jgi:hypothetical protein
MSTEINKYEEKDYSWKKEQEQILKKWADKALCFKLMHERANKKYWCLNAWFNIPIIIISTITGTGNFASSSLSEGKTIIFIIGAFNIFGGILATIATYTGIAQKIEAHRFAYISWDKYARKVQIELSKSRQDRNKAKYFIRQSAEEYDRLMEISPILPNDIIRWFKNLIETGQYEETMPECAHFIYDCICFPCGCNLCYNKKISNKHLFKNIELPEIIGQIKPTEIADVPEQNIIIPITDINSITISNPSHNEYAFYNIEEGNESDI